MPGTRPPSAIDSSASASPATWTPRITAYTVACAASGMLTASSTMCSTPVR